jgi:Ser-Thr-rich glycosyl-phosphatidyl-inositol-anchored membrane family
VAQRSHLAHDSRVYADTRILAYSSTTGSGGKKLDIEWQDDGKAPLVTGADWGRIDIFLATGSVNTQFKLAQLASNLSPSTSSYSATIPANAGPSGKQYFLRFEGSRTDNKTGYPIMAFSARFQLNGMSGSFNSSISAANQGATDPITGATSAGMAMSTSRALTTSAPTFSTAGAAASASSATKSSPAGRNVPMDAALTLSGAIALGALALL